MVSRRGLPAVPHHALLPLRLQQEQKSGMDGHLRTLPRLSAHGLRPDHGQRVALPGLQSQLSAAARFHG